MAGLLENTMINEIVANIKRDQDSNYEGRYTISSFEFREIEVALCESKSR